MQKILITGGSGLIGRRLTEILVAGGLHTKLFGRSKKKKTGGTFFFFVYVYRFFVERAFFVGGGFFFFLGEGDGVEKK